MHDKFTLTIKSKTETTKNEQSYLRELIFAINKFVRYFFEKKLFSQKLIELVNELTN